MYEQTSINFSYEALLPQLRVAGVNGCLSILVGCEESQAVCIELRKLGHKAFSCDLQECSGGHPEWHLQMDVFEAIKGGSLKTQAGNVVFIKTWDMGIFFPECTHLAVSGAKHFEQKRKDGRQQKAIDFFLKIASAPIPRIAIENPVGIMSNIYRKPDQIIQPYQFGHTARKTTCLWLKNLPKLVPTEIVEPKLITLKNGKTFSADYMEGVKRSKAGESSGKRSKTYLGIAKAMAIQWTTAN